MTNPVILKEETTEGNVTEVDLDNRHILIEDRTGTPFMRIFWHKAQEEFDGRPTPLLNQIRKLQKGYYLAAVVEDVDISAGGRVKEAYLKALPFKQRPEDFPRPQQKKSGFGGSGFSGGRSYSTRSEKPIIYQVCYKECCETVRSLILQPNDVLNEKEFNRVMDIALARAKKDAEEIIKASGCQ